MKLKVSDYNFIYDDLGKDHIVMYNSFTGALAVVKEKQYKQFTDYLDTGKEIEDKEFLDNALKCGYLVPKYVDERFLIKTRMIEGRYSNQTLSLTIAPTMACNFRCVYCFEQGSYGKKLMDSTTQKNIIEFIKKSIHKVKSLNISWYGGEPLLALPIIESLSAEFINICKQRQIQYTACIVTNGYLLNKEVAQKLKKCKIDFMQITIDGPKKIHDERRPLINGNGTYDVIMQNLINIEGIIPVSLRINVDHNNICVVDEVVNDLKEKNILSYVSPYLGLVMPYNGNYIKERCLSAESFSKYNLDFLIKNSISLEKAYPFPRTNYCGADYVNSWVIDDEGNMYKCWNDIGIPGKRVGNINFKDNYLQNTRLLDEYMFFNPTEEKKCKNCKLLPICLGGCPHNRVKGENVCEYRKFCMKEYLIEYVSYKRSRESVRN